MLQGDYRWIEAEGCAWLHFRAMCVATVKPQGDRYETRLEWGARQHVAPAGSLAQGKRFIERWIAGQGFGIPTMGRKRRR